MYIHPQIKLVVKVFSSSAYCEDVIGGYRNYGNFQISIFEFSSELIFVGDTLALYIATWQYKFKFSGRRHHLQKLVHQRNF